jgi:hypothetical protein
MRVSGVGFARFITITATSLRKKVRSVFSTIGPVERCVFWRHNLCQRRRLVRVGILACMTVMCGGAHAADDRGQSESIDSQNLTTLSPELVGDQWGWRLAKYRYYEGFYTIADRTFLMLSANVDPTDNVLWDPITGRGLHLNTLEYVKFHEKYESDRNTALRPFPTYGNRHLGAETSPGEVSMCYHMFDHYFVLSDASDRRIIRAFYVARRIDHPRIEKYPICYDGASAETRSIKVEFEEIGYQNSVPLSDGSLMFLSLFEGGLVIIRLDKDGRQHTSVGDAILTSDATRINAELHATPGSDSDPSIRYNIFARGLRAAQTLGTTD